MTIQSLSAAKRLCERSGWTLSNLKLQKILYLAHMVYLGRTRGTPLIDGAFEAWDYGPVQPEVYHKAKIFGRDPVGNVFHDVKSPCDGPERNILDEAFAQLGHADAGQLVHATHKEEGAWAKYYIPGCRHCPIPNDDILEEYGNLDK